METRCWGKGWAGLDRAQNSMTTVQEGMGKGWELVGRVWGVGVCQLTARESIEAVDGSEVLEIVLLSQDEDDSVVSVAAARVYLDAGGDNNSHQSVRWQ